MSDVDARRLLSNSQRGKRRAKRFCQDEASSSRAVEFEVTDPSFVPPPEVPPTSPEGVAAEGDEEEVPPPGPYPPSTPADPSAMLAFPNEGRDKSITNYVLATRRSRDLIFHEEVAEWSGMHPRRLLGLATIHCMVTAVHSRDALAQRTEVRRLNRELDQARREVLQAKKGSEAQGLLVQDQEAWISQLIKENTRYREGSSRTTKDRERLRQEVRSMEATLHE
ncbi:PREDICTED: uncharacterized protein LOC109115195 [Nelumbo nucifera]|uniref:Uncharacterized protein LOC109115195 n=1 Tax=Nelumbo nucifera TaxID=4432 RepID=A0A1U8Q8R5_NELNU|nr:PREDICTED: uncharacterized protein LOC109115195 [Nelumbo nucifera]